MSQSDLVIVWYFEPLKLKKFPSSIQYLSHMLDNRGQVRDTIINDFKRTQDLRKEKCKEKILVSLILRHLQ
jgi:hypothetical protein